MDLIVILVKLLIRFFSWVGDNSSTNRPGESVAQSIARRLPPDQVPPELRDLIASDLAASRTRQPAPRLADQIAQRMPASVRDQLARERAAVLKKRQAMQANRSAEDVRLAARRAAQMRPAAVDRSGIAPPIPPPARAPQAAPRPLGFVPPRQPQAVRRAAPPARKAAPVRPPAAAAMPASPALVPIAQAGSTASIEASGAQILARGLVSRTAHVTSANADSILVRLQQRDSLRAQILITELLGPPIALRG